MVGFLFREKRPVKFSTEGELPRSCTLLPRAPSQYPVPLPGAEATGGEGLQAGTTSSGWPPAAAGRTKPGELLPLRPAPQA